MYAYVMRRATLPSSYYKFIVQSGPVHPTALNFVENANRSIAITPQVVHQFLKRTGSSFLYSATSCHPAMLPCHILHAKSSTCSHAVLQAFLKGMRRTFPLYLSLHLVPSLVLHLKRFIQKYVHLYSAWKFEL